MIKDKRINTQIKLAI